jgi:3-hydroxyisobutyrate dehydrogenase-like beta-hydroxyacid dehydrogenase
MAELDFNDLGIMSKAVVSQLVAAGHTVYVYEGTSFDSS